jgi:hypothetical protein
MITFTLLVVPSIFATLNVSLKESRLFKLSKAELAVNVLTPVASIFKIPMEPVIDAGVKTVSGLSISTLVKVPPVVIGALASATLTSALLTVAASFVPVTLIVIVFGAVWF